MDSKQERRKLCHTKDVRHLHIEAVCNHIFDIWRGDCYDELVPGRTYLVTIVRLTSDFCYVSLEGCPREYNGVCFSFFDKGKEYDITQDERCYSEALIDRNRRIHEYLANHPDP